MTKEQLGAFIADNRRDRGLTQRDLAEKLHITDKAVSKWERGLSYPDVTLLEPLAEVFGLGVEELVACRRAEEKREEEQPVKNILEISRENRQSDRRRTVIRTALGALAVVGLALLVAWYSTAFVHEQRENTIILKETVGDTNYLYVEERGHLLRLRCENSIDFGAIQQTNPESGLELVYRLDCRWNRWTRRGTATNCEATGREFLGGITNADVDEGEGALFGLPMVYRTSRDYCPNPYGKGYLCDYVCWRFLDMKTWETETILTVEDCVSATPWDLDGDRVNELVVRTRWPEKPYTVYDMEGGEFVESWPDTVPEEVRENLVCIWEQ